MQEAFWWVAKGSSTWKGPDTQVGLSPAEQEVPVQAGTQDTTHSERLNMSAG